MSHVDEGALHAYLDDALDEYPAAEAKRVREHLAACPECAERLEEERRVRDRAGAILDLAAPDVEIPSLEELREYVRTTAAPRSRASVRLQRLGWAASVALALGTGWMLRDARGPARVAGPGDDVLLEAPAQEAGPDAAGGQSAPSAPQAVASRADPAEGAERRAAGAVGGDPLTRAAPPERMEAVAGRGRVEAEAAIGETLAAAPAENVAAAAPETPTEPPAETVAAAEGALSPLADTAVRPDDRAALADRAERAAPAEVPATAGAVAAPAAADAARAARAAVPETVPAAELDKAAYRFAPAAEAAAADAGTSPLAVPGLEVLEVTSMSAGGAAASAPVVRVLQRLPGGDTLTLFHLPAGADASSLPAPGEHLSELVVPRPGGRLIMRAPVAPATLSDLLARLDSVAGPSR